MINVSIIGGYLGQDPEVTTLPEGQKVARIRICTTERGYLTRTGQQVPDRNTWHSCNLWGNLANYAPNLHKGDFVVLRGKYHTREVTNEQTGEVRTFYNFDADEVLWTPPKTQDDTKPKKTAK